jgi:glycosyltransferase involved in cell wall biosynthesis
MAMISVIIPHLNQSAGLEECLCSLDVQTLDRSLFEIIVVDNGSATLPAEVIARHSGVRLLHESHPGPGPARNTGTRAATGDVFAFIDADCRAHPDWLSTAQRVLRSSPSRTILGGDVRIWRDKNEDITPIEAYESVFAYRFKLYIEQHGFSGTGNLVVSRSDFETIGPFAGIEIAEDMEWGRRACSAAFRFCYVPEMIVFHPARRSLDELYAKWDRQIQHYLNMARGKPIWRFRWIARALLTLASPIIDVATVFNSDRIHGTPARINAITILCKIRAHRAFKMLSLLYSSKSILWNRDLRA